mmetsp:Transcript_3945/g.11427  ORF Transcript_3945/g.11427 Transcript_3945/m.11427 type:complete len:533 (-) Transcript_3945:176-1774(-)
MSAATASTNLAQAPPPTESIVTLRPKGKAALKQAAEAARPAPPAEKLSLYERQEQELQHFSSLLFGGSALNTAVEFGVRLAIFVVGATNPGGYFTPAPGAASLMHVALMMTAASLFTRVYNAYLEFVYAKCPHYRTQPEVDHALKAKADITGRLLEDLESQNWHDRMTLLMDGVLAIAMMYLNPGFYPGADGPRHSWLERGARLLVHRYVLCFTMYWAHRAGHVVPWLWKNVHGRHHQATHPLSRVTYQAHFFDNFMNAIYGHTFAQIVVPLDHTTYYFNIFLRIMESLEKHSGTSSAFNVAHNLQRFLPYAQMPHHHDLHHEGSKRCNYTFSAAGGLWDWAFGTRKAGRAQFVDCVKQQATPYDLVQTQAANSARAEAEAALVAAQAAGGEAEGEVTVEALAQHNQPDDMWIAVGGVVYDVTKYAARHPGGRQVLADVAGRDATQDFDDVGHTAKARMILKSLKVGTLRGAAATGPKLDEESFWNGHIAVHAPILAMVGVVAATGAPGVVPLCAFCTAVLAAETLVCHFNP